MTSPGPVRARLPAAHGGRATPARLARRAVRQPAPSEPVRAARPGRRTSDGGHHFGRVTVSDHSIDRERERAARAAGPGRQERFFLSTGPEDERKKIEGEVSTGAKIFGTIGAVAGAIVGGIVGGPLGALAGLVAGGLAGAGLGALGGLIVRLIRGGGGGISWDRTGYAASAAAGDSTTLERPFNVSYRAEQDKPGNVWRLKVASIRGGADIDVRTGGSRDPFTHPPTTEAEAQAAVTDMQGYYARGSRGAWHTEAASRAHEEHHVREWQCSAEHYWPTAKAAVETLTAPLASTPTEAAAVTAMRAGPTGADAKIAGFAAIARQYWFTLSDAASSRPYAAGQRVLNNAIRHVQDLAAGRGWTVARGTDSPSPEPPCYQPWLPYAP